MSGIKKPKAAPRSRIVSALVLATGTAAILSACGGGGGGSNWALPTLALGGTPATPASAPTSSPAPSTTTTDDSAANDQSSTPCVNEADYRPGTQVEFSASTSAPVTGRAPFQRKSVTGAREPFAKVNPVPFTTASTVKTVDSAIPGSTSKSTSTTTELRKEYRDLVAGNVVIYGEFESTESMVTITPATPDPAIVYEPVIFANSRSRTFDPAITFPITMQPGSTVTQRSRRVDDITYRSGNTTMLAPSADAGSALFSLTYNGRERITTVLGTFDTCRFTFQSTVSQGTSSVQLTQDHWVAAEGPYRGQMLRLKKNGAVWDVTTLTYSAS